MKAPAGPPIWTRLPPSADTIKNRRLLLHTVRAPTHPRNDSNRHRERQCHDGDRQNGRHIAPKRFWSVIFAGKRNQNVISSLSAKIVGSPL